jgi:hypothetical protein
MVPSKGDTVFFVINPGPGFENSAATNWRFDERTDAKHAAQRRCSLPDDRRGNDFLMHGFAFRGRICQTNQVNALVKYYRRFVDNRLFSDRVYRLWRFIWADAGSFMNMINGFVSEE